MDFTERDECKPVLLELSLARNLVKRLISLYGTECREFCSAWIPLPERTTTPAQAVFGSALILPDRFLDFAELPSDEFLTQFSHTLSAAEHHSTRHNTTAARRPPPKLPDAPARAPTVMVWRNRHFTPLLPLYVGPYTVIQRFLHHFALWLKACSDPMAPPPLPSPGAVQLSFALGISLHPSPKGDTAARRAYFALPHTEEPRQCPNL
jgi:hypothetical protein